MSFRGLHPINLDAKGRMAVPARFRTVIDEHNCNGKLVVTIEHGGESLVIYPLNEFEEIERKIQSLSSFDEVAVRLKRLVIGHATDVDMDASGRILIPPALRSYVGLEKKVMLVGQGKKLELWDADVWDLKREQMLQIGNEKDQLSEELRSLSL